MCDYGRLANYAFRRKAQGALDRIKAVGLLADWNQEMRLAAWLAERDQLDALDALRFFGRCAHAAPRDMGFRHRKHGGGYFQRA